MNDFEISSHGRPASLYVVTPLTDDAREFSERMFADAMTWGQGYVVEHRYIEDVMYDLVMSQGFAVSLDGQDVLGMVAA